MCSELKADLALLRREFEFTWSERNIEDDPEDWERFRYLIPVLEIEGKTLLYPPHSLYSVRHALLAAHEESKSVPS